jgi:hypothetical protein
MKNKINAINQNIYTLQNSLRIINARKSIEKHKTILLCLTINFKLYLTKLKNIHKKRMNKIAKYIINQARERIVYNEYNNLWNKLNPFFIRFLTTKRHKEKMNKAKRRVMEEKFNKCMKIFQFNLLIKKVEERKEKVKFIYNFSSTKVMSNYWINLIKNILVIQKYIRITKDKNKTLKTINDKYFNDDPNTLINEANEIEEDLFPSTKLSKFLLETNNNIESNNSNNNTARIQSKLFKNIKGVNPLDNKTPNLTTISSKTPNQIFKSSNYQKKKYISELKSKIKNEYLPEYRNYSKPKITVFAKILDLDIINDSNDI